MQARAFTLTGGWRPLPGPLVSTGSDGEVRTRCEACPPEPRCLSCILTAELTGRIKAPVCQRNFPRDLSIALRKKREESNGENGGGGRPLKILNIQSEMDVGVTAVWALLVFSIHRTPVNVLDGVSTTCTKCGIFPTEVVAGGRPSGPHCPAAGAGDLGPGVTPAP